MLLKKNYINEKSITLGTFVEDTALILSAIFSCYLELNMLLVIFNIAWYVI